MKKLMAVLLVAVLLFPCLALASNIDLKSMTDDELLALNVRIISELMSRGKAATVPTGIYIVGKHLPAGEYSLTTKSDFAAIEIDNEKDAYGDHWQSFSFSGSESIGRVVLIDGDFVEISYAPIVFQSFSGIVFK